MKIGGGLRAVAEQVPHPEPGNAAEGRFQCTGPIDAQRVWVRFLPRIPLRHNFCRVHALGRQAPSLGECDQVLVTIQFPDEFVISN